MYFGTLVSHSWHITIDSSFLGRSLLGNITIGSVFAGSEALLVLLILFVNDIQVIHHNQTCFGYLEYDH